jgi:hypothetical protein
LFHAFVANFELKSNFRNSLNDILTLAVAGSDVPVADGPKQLCLTI